MKRFGKRYVVTCAFVTLLASRATAGPSPTDVATARELYKQGADALDAGNSLIAVDKLTAAWSLVQSPIIGFDLARAHEKLRHLVESREAALAVVRLPIVAGETSLSTQARAQAEKLADALAARIPHIELTIAGVDRDHATVKLDGTVIPTAALPLPRQANPGQHTATLDTDDGRHAEGSVIVGETESKQLTLTVRVATIAVKETPQGDIKSSDGVSPPPDAVVTHKSLSPLVWIGGVTAGAGFAVGAIAGAISLANADSLRKDCQIPGGGDTFLCDPTHAGELSSAQTTALVSTIGFIVAGVGLGVFVTGLLLGGSTTSSSSAHARIAPMLGPITGFAGTF